MRCRGSVPAATTRTPSFLHSTAVVEQCHCSSRWFRASLRVFDRIVSLSSTQTACLRATTVRQESDCSDRPPAVRYPLPRSVSIKTGLSAESRGRTVASRPQRSHLRQIQQRFRQTKVGVAIRHGLQLHQHVPGTTRELEKACPEVGRKRRASQAFAVADRLQKRRNERPGHNWMAIPCVQPTDPS